MEIADQDNRAEWAYATCCEIWEIQGRARCKAFFRAIFEAVIQPMLAVREGCFSHQLELYQKRTGTRVSQDLSAIGGHMKREQAKLQAKWNTKLEIAARDNEYEQQRASRDKPQKSSALATPSPAKAIESGPHAKLPSLSMDQISTAASSFTWKELESRFRELQAKSRLGEGVAADFTRTEWEFGEVSEDWAMRGPVICRTEFEHLACIAARKLGYAASEDALRYWLERLRGWLIRAGLDKDRDMAWCPTGGGHSKGRFYTTSHLNVDSIADLSAMFCVELLSGGIPESTISLPPKLEEERGKPKSGRAVQMAKRSKTQSHKMGVIFGAIQSGLTAAKYCTALDGRRVRLPVQWAEENCPATYTQAYRAKKWRKRIQDEKSRYRKQYERMSIQDRDALIQCETTRRTRQ